MKRNNQCVKQVLIYIEDKTPLFFRKYESTPFYYEIRTISYNEICNAEELAAFSKEDIVYSLIHLIQERYISATFDASNQIKDICNITEKGHNKLDEFRQIE